MVRASASGVCSASAVTSRIMPLQCWEGDYFCREDDYWRADEKTQAVKEKVINTRDGKEDFRFGR